MRCHRATSVVGLLILAAAPAAAQKPGTVELGGFGRYTRFDGNLGFANRVGVGGRLGVFVLRNLSLEGDASYTGTYSTDGALIRAIPIHARLLYGLPMGAHTALLIGGGYTRQLFRRGYRETGSGAGGLLGLRLGTGGTLNIRLDATADYIGDAESAVPQLAGITREDHNWHLGIEGGLSAYLFARPDRDRDHDGVMDSVDRCLGTPPGEPVDITGCPLPKDTDGDGVVDTLDRCPATPAGTPVDTRGCPRDSDGDGVIDRDDKCPATPAGTAVDATGCPRDTDQDGVIDRDDKCPNTPAGTAVDAAGCPRDSDGDGVIDTLDRCPNTPAHTEVDATGCPVDSDRDGVIDANDKCPGTPAGTKVDATGCPDLFGAGASLVLQGVTFDVGKATLRPESKAILDRVAASLGANPTVRVEVGGHTSSTGPRAVNLRLSQARADAVRTYLISRGVPASRLTAKGYGPDKPVADNGSAAGRAANRRVELTRLP
jgi:outer membrane protein OmpA-like peptidoglycan-associated protein